MKLGMFYDQCNDIIIYKVYTSSASQVNRVFFYVMDYADSESEVQLNLGQPDGFYPKTGHFSFLGKKNLDIPEHMKYNNCTQTGHHYRVKIVEYVLRIPKTARLLQLMKS